MGLGFSHLNEHKFKHSYIDTFNPVRTCRVEAEIATHFFLPCRFYNVSRTSLMNDVNEIGSCFSGLSENKFLDLLLHGNDKFDDKKSHRSLVLTIKLH